MVLAFSGILPEGGKIRVTWHCGHAVSGQGHLVACVGGTNTKNLGSAPGATLWHPFATPMVCRPWVRFHVSCWFLCVLGEGGGGAGGAGELELVQITGGGGVSSLLYATPPSVEVGRRPP